MINIDMWHNDKIKAVEKINIFFNDLTGNIGEIVILTIKLLEILPRTARQTSKRLLSI